MFHAKGSGLGPKGEASLAFWSLGEPRSALSALLRCEWRACGGGGGGCVEVNDDVLLPWEGSDGGQWRSRRACSGPLPIQSPRDKVLKVGMTYLFITIREVGK